MTVVPAQFPSVGPADSLEVRWFVPGPLGTAARDWFGRFPAGTEAREDVYLVLPCLDGLSVKLRDGGGLDVKSYLGSPGILDLPPAGLLLGAVKHAADLLFARPLPDGERFSLGNSLSYAQWLYRQPSMHGAQRLVR